MCDETTQRHVVPVGRLHVRLFSSKFVPRDGTHVDSIGGQVMVDDVSRKCLGDDVVRMGDIHIGDVKTVGNVCGGGVKFGKQRFRFDGVWCLHGRFPEESRAVAGWRWRRCVVVVTVVEIC